MALTATASKGLELHRYIQENEVLYVPGMAGDTYTKGNAVVGTVGEGVVDPASANEGGIVGIVDKTTVCSAATTVMPWPTLDIASDASKDCLIPIRPVFKAGTPVYKATFANHYDDTVTGYTEATRKLLVTTGMAVNDYPNGALIYIYEGPGAGQVNIVEDYIHGELALVMLHNWHTVPTAASKVIVLAGEAAGSRGVGFFNRCELGAAGSLTVNQGADDGDFVVYMDFREAATHLKNLMLLVVPARYEGLA